MEFGREREPVEDGGNRGDAEEQRGAQNGDVQSECAVGDGREKTEDDAGAAGEGKDQVACLVLSQEGEPDSRGRRKDQREKQEKDGAETPRPAAETILFVVRVPRKISRQFLCHLRCL